MMFQLYNSFPGVMELLPGPHKKILKDWETVKDFVRKEIKQHKDDRDPKMPRDYIDCYLTEIENVVTHIHTHIFHDNYCLFLPIHPSIIWFYQRSIIPALRLCDFIFRTKPIHRENLRRRIWWYVLSICSSLDLKPPPRHCAGLFFTWLNILKCRVRILISDPSGGKKNRSDHPRFYSSLCTRTEKVQAEIDDVIGQSRQPSVMDRAGMPYTDAVLHEIQRIGNIAPLSLPRITTRTVQIGEYTIPKVQTFSK